MMENDNNPNKKVGRKENNPDTTIGNWIIGVKCLY